MRPSPIRHLVSPPILSAIGPPCGFFPLGFGGQTLSKPCAVSHGAIPRRFHHRMILRARIRRPLASPTVNPRVVIIDVVPSLSVNRLRTLSAKKLRELCVCHRRSVDEKFTDIYLVLRPLVLRTICTSHEKHFARDANHLNIVF